MRDIKILHYGAAQTHDQPVEPFKILGKNKICQMAFAVGRINCTRFLDNLLAKLKVFELAKKTSWGATHTHQLL